MYKRITLIVICVLSLIASTHTFSQNFIETLPVKIESKTKQILDNQLFDYQIFTLKEGKLERLLLSESLSQTTIKIGENTLDFNLKESNILSPTFQGTAFTNSGTVDLSEHIQVRGFRGRVDGESKSHVTFTVNSLFMMAIIQIESDVYYIQSLHHFTKNFEDLNTYVYYKLEDLIPLENTICHPVELGKTEKRDKKIVPNDEIKAPADPTIKEDQTPQNFMPGVNCPYEPTSINSNSITTTSCRLAQIAAEADWEFVQDQGGGFFGAIVSFGMVFNNIMAAEAPYVADLAVSFQISRIRVYSGFADDDPFPDGYTPNNIICGNYNDDIRAAYATDDIPRDLIVLYSGIIDGAEAFSACGAFGTGILSGIAHTSSLCADGVAIIFNSSNNFPLTTGHEIGHVFGAPHTTGNGAANCAVAPCNAALAPMMCNGSCNPRGIFFDAIDVGNINGFLNTNGGCLDDSDLGELIGSNLVCKDQTERYRFAPHHVASGSIWTFPNNTWQVGPGLSISSQSPYGIAVSASSNYFGKSWIQVTVGGITNCVVTVRREVMVNGMPPIPCTDYVVCAEDLVTISPNLGIGVTINSLDCISSNCGGLNYWANPPYSILVFTGGAIGTYTFRYTFTNSCGTFTQYFYVEVVDNMKGKDCNIRVNGDDEKRSKKDNVNLNPTNFKVSPNPATNDILVEYYQKDISPVLLELYDTNGKIVRKLAEDRSGQIGQISIRHDISDLSDGVYFIRFNGVSETKIMKFVKAN